MSNLSNYLEQKLIDHILNEVAFSVPLTTYVGLFTTMPADDGTGGVEVTGGSYARVLVNQNGGASPTWDLGVSEGTGRQHGFLVDNTHEVLFPQATADWGTVVGFGIFDASTAGNLLYYGLLYTGPKFFVGLDTGDIIHCVAHGFTNGQKVMLWNDQGGLPTGLSEATEYFVISAATDNFQLSLTSGGAAIAITANGAGTVGLSRVKVIGTDDTFRFPIGDLDLAIR